MKTDVCKIGNDIKLDRNRSIRRMFVVLSIFMALSILFSTVIHLQAGLIFLAFFTLATIIMLTISFLANYTMAVINLHKKEVSLSSKIASQTIKQTKIISFNKLYFDSYTHQGYKKFAILADEKEGNLIWNDLKPDQAKEISDMLGNLILNENKC